MPGSPTAAAEPHIDPGSQEAGESASTNVAGRQQALLQGWKHTATCAGQGLG